MHLLFEFCQWLEQTSTGTAIRESLWLFPIIETIHIFGIISLVGSTSILDLRLMGLTFREEPVSKLAKRFLPWAWAGFVVQVVTGLLLFSSEATKMVGNAGFQYKMLMILVAGLNAFVFHSIAYQSVGKWDRDPVAPLSARIAGLLSILLWFGIVAAGRWIAYV
jgi:Na+-transporting methylmalonyl-CoA/oxaloacetate decarboxylase beta subunit